MVFVDKSLKYNIWKCWAIVIGIFIECPPPPAITVRAGSEYLKIVSIKIRIFATSFCQSWATLKIYDHISWLRKSFVGFSKENVISGVFVQQSFKSPKVLSKKIRYQLFQNVKIFFGTNECNLSLKLDKLVLNLFIQTLNCLFSQLTNDYSYSFYQYCQPSRQLPGKSDHITSQIAKWDSLWRVFEHNKIMTIQPPAVDWRAERALSNCVE